MLQDREVVYRPGPTIERALASTKLYVLLIGARGTEKSTGALMGMVSHSASFTDTQWPFKWAMIRDTRRNLGTTTVPLIKEWFPPEVSSFWTGKELEPEYCRIKLKGHERPVVECLFVGCDAPKDMDRFQSFECDGAVVEEPAPAMDISGGITADVIGMLRSSMRRSRYPKIFIPMNYPDDTHWAAQIWQIRGYKDPQWEGVRQAAAERIRQQSDVFYIPVHEAVHVELKQPGYREQMRDMFLTIGREDLVKRLVDGSVATVHVGTPVTPEYSSLFEVDAVPPVSPGEHLFFSWDPRTYPTAILWRPATRGYCDILACWQIEHGGIRQLIEEQILPWMSVHVPDGVQWGHTGDPTATAADQSSSTQSALQTILTLLPGRRLSLMARQPTDLPSHWTPGPTGWDDRRNAVHDILRHPYLGGRPWLRIDKRFGQPLIQALAGGWKYSTDPSGRVHHDHPVKDQYGDTGDAFAYGCALILRRQGVQSIQERFRQSISQQARDHRPFPFRGTGV